ncbi:protein TIC 21, chloroplastic [Nymphaea colorata]|nr:protein TIC 21, chloroplastic [Nymphaea colorata]XP_031495737.1 protein TIC 21, chloroplastic [Nymphaea colorata]
MMITQAGLSWQGRAATAISSPLLPRRSHVPKAPNFNSSSLPLTRAPPPLTLSRLSCSPLSPLLSFRLSSSTPLRVSSPASSAPSSYSNEELEKKLAQVSKRLESTSRYLKRLGSLGFWGQLVCTVVAAVILSFSVVITGRVTSPVTFYCTAGGISAAFMSAFWSFGYTRLADKLQRTATDPEKAPPRAEVINSLKNAILINILGMGAAVLGMQSTVGLLVAKALTSSATPYYQGMRPGYSPVLALDVFLVQASANTILSHFLGLVLSLELLRFVTLPLEAVAVPRGT